MTRLKLSRTVSIALLTFMSFYFCCASPLIILTPDINEISLESGNYEFGKDSIGLMSFDDIRNKKDFFQLNQEDYRYNEDLSSSYWIRFQIQNQTKYTWVLECLSQQTELVEVYTPDNNGIYNVQKAGTLFPFPERPYIVKNFVFNLPVGQQNPYWVYIKVKSSNHSGFLFDVRTHELLNLNNTTEYYLHGFYYGILIIMALYNLLLYISIRVKTYLLYVAFVLSCLLVSASEDGLGFQYIWPFSPEWNIPIDYYVAPIALLFFFLTYSVSFLELRIKHPKAYRLLWVVAGIYFTYFILQVFLKPYVPYIPGMYAIPFLTAYFISIYVWTKGYQPARYYTIGFTFIVISVLINQLRNLNILDTSNMIYVYSFNIANLFEVVTFSYALGDRFRIMKKEKEEAQSATIIELKEKESYKNSLIKEMQEKEELKDKVNRELEQKVRERTHDLEEKSHELEDSNAKLQIAIGELNKMNVQLDLNNWGLQKKVSEETKLRILSEEVSYEEFLKIFPNDSACLRYLEEIKWGNTYKCHKCGNDKYNQPKPFTRKCTKCWHIESVTALTLFHGTKFPLTKAFYIVYLTLNSKEKMTIEELSETLELRKNTCWAFKKKVVERLEEMQKKKGRAITKWENLFID